MSLKWQEHNWLGGLEALPERKQDLQSPSLISDVQDITRCRHSRWIQEFREHIQKVLAISAAPLSNFIQNKNFLVKSLVSLTLLSSFYNIP